ncbi:MAG: pilin [Candidatus Nealsonbacteria bacterium DGGOD1a]|jgi:hypothetical protein|nr:MAG: pilin [Candidatus Nealsonbacteria bacterium DGGOD1a]
MKKIIASLLLSLLMAPALIFAADSITPKADSSLAGDIGKNVKMSDQPLDQTLNTVANYAIGILIIIAVFYVIWAGYTFVTSSGDTEKINTARQRIMFAAIGIVVALLAKGIISLVLSAISNG